MKERKKEVVNVLTVTVMWADGGFSSMGSISYDPSVESEISSTSGDWTGMGEEFERDSVSIPTD